MALLLYRARLMAKLAQLTRAYQLSDPNLNLSLTSQITRMMQRSHVRCDRLRQNVTDLQHIIDALPIGYLQVDDENQLTWCNPQALQLLEIENFDSSSPRLLLEIVRSYDLDALIDRARHKQKSCMREWVFNPVSVDVANVQVKQSRPLRGYAFPLQEDCVAVILENREEATLLAQQRDRWTSDVAHELRTPLTSIRLVAEMLQYRVDEDSRQWVDRLLKEVIRLSTLVQEILDLSQLEASKNRPLKLSRIDLPQLIQSAWLSLEPISRTKGIDLRYQGPERLILEGDENRLHRVLINLLDNGIKYTIPDRPIRITVNVIQNPVPTPTWGPANATTMPWVQVDIIDGGLGFPAEIDLSVVFERFYRADPSRTRQSVGPHGLYSAQPSTLQPSTLQPSTPSSLSSASEAIAPTLGQSSNTPSYSSPSRLEVQPFQPSSGSGLGLAIVRQIVEMHHGTVTAQNHPDGGAWIQIKLPQKQS
nr:PAS domain-containing sensor histidine kinase [Alkalinema sp. FACHB-956]